MDIYAVTGHLGSGKTEVAVNLAIRMAHTEGSPPVAIVDIDVINPYFAAREARTVLGSHGITIAAPSIKTTTADLPVLSGEIYQLLHREDHVLILDVGGDPAGARILRSLSDHLQGNHLHVYCVVNTKRPYTSDKQGVISYIKNISAASHLPITGLIHNTHLLDETSAQDIYQGQKILEQVSRETNLPIVFTTVMKTMVGDIGYIENEVLPMERYIKPPYVL